MKEYLIYKITHKESGKSYIGRTKDLKRRIEQHKKAKCHSLLSRAIQKYGIDEFKISVIKKDLTFKEAVNQEFLAISKHNTLNPKGYNLILETNQGREMTKEVRQNMSQGQQNRLKFGEKKLRGVRKRRNQFECRVRFDKTVYSKLFDDQKEAYEAYDKINLYLKGKNCYLNFPENKKSYLKTDLKKYFKWFCQKHVKSSKYIGVAFRKDNQKWRAYHYLNGKRIDLGCFETEKDAYEAAKKYYK